MLGKAVRRQGISKSKVELDEISEVFKKLSESSILPMFIGTSTTIIKTHVYNIESDKCDNNTIATRLKVLEESVSSLIKETKEKGTSAVTPLLLHVPGNSDDDSSTVNSVNNGIPMNTTWANIVRNPTLENARVHNKKTNESDQNEGRKLVKPKTQETRTKQWRQRLNILRGTASDESGNESLSADIHLVAYGVAKHVTGIQLSHFLENRGLDVLSYDLLTKYEQSRCLSYKVSMKSCNYEKAQYFKCRNENRNIYRCYREKR